MEAERARILKNWHDERDSALLYDALARLECNPLRRSVFAKLASSERVHSIFWERRLRELGADVPEFRPSVRARLMIALAERLGLEFVLPRITSRELADQHRYAAQEDAQAAGLHDQERGHAAVMRRVSAFAGDSHGSETDPQAPSLANDLRAAVLGATDGLSSNFCLLMGVTGAGVATGTVLITGVAGLIAGACSMALGEWLSVTNALEMARAQMDADLKELHRGPRWSREELELIHQARGLGEPEAALAAERVLAQDPHALQALIGDELAMSLAHGSNNPVTAAAYSFALFAVGAAVPLLPFVLTARSGAPLWSAAASLLALFGLGLATSFFNGRSPLYSGLRQLAIGAAAAAVTFGAGHLVGHVVG